MKVLAILIAAVSVCAFAGSGRLVHRSDSLRAPTYSNEVATILDKHCVQCHRPGEVAPFSLIGYANAKKWSATVAVACEKRVMPPWKAVAGYGEFTGENRLTDSEILALENWAGAGAPEGDPKAIPATPKFPKPGEWSLGKPDLVLSLPAPFKLAADGPTNDQYRNFVFKTDYKEPVWVKAMDIRPGNRAIVHHVIAFLDRSGISSKLEQSAMDGQAGYTTDGGGVGFLPSGALGGWAPGAQPQMAPEGTAFLLQPGTSIVLQVHYHRDGKPEEDQTKLAIYLAHEPITKEMKLNWIFNFGIDVPAGEKSYQARRVYTYSRPVTVYGAMPHMHLLGRSMKSWFELPDGTVKPLVDVEDWDFNWQLTYRLKEPMHLPAGTRQYVQATYDNTDGNPRNPFSPPHEVRWGEGTTDEMFLMIVSYTDDARIATPANR